ncbi:MAG: hypothetical protein JKY65_11795 [Planctomycetes bacterium]|nr:hypothetical protein [Planctomycetota bacterium]
MDCAAVDLTPATAPAETAESSWQRFGEVVDELLLLLDLLGRAPEGQRRPVYAKCVPLIKEIGLLNKPPYDVRKVKALIFEASWHLRSLAGLAATNSSGDDEHAAWALASLEGLAVCAKLRLAAAR